MRPGLFPALVQGDPWTFGGGLTIGVSYQGNKCGSRGGMGSVPTSQSALLGTVVMLRRSKFPMRRIALLAAFVSLLAVACADGSAAGVGSGIRGKVLIGPQCPVEQEGSPCPDKPFEGTVQVTTESGRPVDSVRSDRNGSFEIELQPGAYVVTVVGLEGPTFAKPITVTVRSGQMTAVTVLVDTGIRGPAGP